jgi:hypothetical protein
VQQSKLDTLTEKVDVGFKDVKDGFKGIGRWMMLLIGGKFFH